MGCVLSLKKRQPFLTQVGCAFAENINPAAWTHQRVSSQGRHPLFDASRTKLFVSLDIAAISFDSICWSLDTVILGSAPVCQHQHEVGQQDSLANGGTSHGVGRRLEHVRV